MRAPFRRQARAHAQSGSGFKDDGGGGVSGGSDGIKDLLILEEGFW